MRDVSIAHALHVTPTRSEAWPADRRLLMVGAQTQQVFSLALLLTHSLLP